LPSLVSLFLTKMSFDIFQLSASLKRLLVSSRRNQHQAGKEGSVAALKGSEPKELCCLEAAYLMSRLVIQTSYANSPSPKAEIIQMINRDRSFHHTSLINHWLMLVKLDGTVFCTLFVRACGREFRHKTRSLRIASHWVSWTLLSVSGAGSALKCYGNGSLHTCLGLC
jgi:hypothetical protein